MEESPSTPETANGKLNEPTCDPLPVTPVETGTESTVSDASNGGTDNDDEEGEGSLSSSPSDASDKLHHHLRTNSAPTSLQVPATPANSLLSKEAHEEAMGRTHVEKITTSMPAVPVPDKDSPAGANETGEESRDVKNQAFEEFINSPQGQHTIVEKSPGGRYVRFSEKLGSGASKDVYRAYDTIEGIEVAWNVVNLAGVPKTERNRIVNEVRLLESLHHHNIISFHGSWVNRERQEVNFVTEILSSGTLKSFIDKVQVIRWKIAKRWAVQILKGLEYLHSQDPVVIHRDLKCDNIFINGTSGDLRIGDLGLSTVHRNGQVLSVLGTPEFMAPDLYEESAYDEKVDIYAFGMCLLEILTKEIPYSECSNPAQIYRKVLNGELPQSLGRLKSQHARDFIMLCLGHKDENGKYIRPSSSELVSHPFLAKGADDDSVVEMLPPLQERTILESPLESAEEAQGTTKSQSEGEQEQPRRISRRPTESSMADDSDQFEEMPDSEVNIGKVKVMMGRGHELDDSGEVDITPQSSIRSTEGLTQSVSPLEAPAINGSASQERVHPPPAGEEGAPPKQALDLAQYLVAAAVIEEEAPIVRPYEDDVLKLIITLPVDGQQQNVQFDFHLVRDDPVQVAREMVEELDIPQEAVLEVSSTISGLARQARIRQDKYDSRQRVLAEQLQRGQIPPQGAVPQQVPANVDQQHQPPVPQQVGQLPQGGGQPQQQPPPPIIQQQASHLPLTVDQQQQQQPPPIIRQQGSQLPPPSQTPAAPQSGQTSVAGAQPLTAGLQPPLQPARPSGQLDTSMSWTDDGKQGMTVPASTQTVVSKEAQEELATEALIPEGLGLTDSTQSTSADGDEDDEEKDDEIRQLDEEFQKNMKRAQKVFDNRMDNLQRSVKEKEVQHLKTLEKHNKEKIEYEKRLKQESQEQVRRLEELQREWDRRRESLASSKQVGKKAGGSLPNSPASRPPPPPPPVTVATKPIVPLHHQRSASTPLQEQLLPSAHSPHSSLSSSPREEGGDLHEGVRLRTNNSAPILLDTGMDSSERSVSLESVDSS